MLFGTFLDGRRTKLVSPALGTVGLSKNGAYGVAFIYKSLKAGHGKIRSPHKHYIQSRSSLIGDPFNDVLGIKNSVQMVDFMAKSLCKKLAAGNFFLFPVAVKIFNG